MADDQERIDEEDRSNCWMKYICVLTDLSHVPTFARQDRLPEAAINSLDSVMEDYRCNGPTVLSQQMSVLIQAGIPDCWRGQLWQLFLSSLTAGYNREIRSRRYKRLAALVSGPKSKRCFSEHQDGVEHSTDIAFQTQLHPRDVEQVEKDLHRTWSQSTLTRRMPSEATLRRVLLAYAHHNPEIGYCQGMNFLAGMLLLYLPEESAFWTLADIVEKYLENYFLESMLGVVVDQLVCRELIQRHFPLVSEHAEVLQVDLGLVTTQWYGVNLFFPKISFREQSDALFNRISRWLLTAFVNVLPKEAVLRVWDIMLFTRAPVVLLRVLLMVFEMNVKELLDCKDSLELWTLVVSSFEMLCREIVQELRSKHKAGVLEKSPDNVEPGQACTPWLRKVPKHPNVCAEVDLEALNQDLEASFFGPLSEQAESAAWSFCRLSSAARSSDSQVEGAQGPRRTSSADAPEASTVSEEDAAENSPMTLRSHQKSAISQLLPDSHDTAGLHFAPDSEDQSSPVLPERTEHGTAVGAQDVLEKPTFATQLVLGCYAATQKAAGGQSKAKRGAVKGKLMQLHSLERAVLSQQQQLMQIQAQMQRVVLATNRAQKDRQRKVNECAQHEEAEKRHHNDAIDLCARIEFTKELFPSCLAELDQADQAYEQELARHEEVDLLLQTLAQSHLKQ